ncbi:conserved hypothetical protein [Hyphomicrobiales bacterium]|nr:conserved hypothetical protein [Hyphomicrobiales bacterium]CAH1668451.1 conserved hypothetical protein [Hyphomicrobiales bacterium]
MCTELRTSISWDQDNPVPTGRASRGKSMQVARAARQGVALCGALGVIAILAGAQLAVAQSSNQFQRDYQQQNRAIERQLQDNSQQQLQQQQMNQIRSQQMRQQLTPPPYVPPPPVQNFRR